MSSAAPRPRPSPVQLEHGHTRIAHPVLEGLMLAPFNTSQLKVLMYHIRESYGWSRPDAELNYARIREATGLAKSSVADAVTSLIGAEVLEVVTPPGFRSSGRYKLNKDPRCWKAPYACTPPSLLSLLESGEADSTGQPDSTGKPNSSENEPNSTGQPNGRVPASRTLDAPETLRENGSQPPKAIESKERKVGGSWAALADLGPEDAADRIIIAANRGMADNPAIGDPYNPIPPDHTSRRCVLGWLAQGVKADVVAAVVYTEAKRFKPQPRRRQISSMGYFQNPVLAEHDRVQASSTGAPPERHHDDRRQPASVGPVGVPADTHRQIAAASAQLEQDRARAEAWATEHPAEVERIREDARARLSGEPFFSTTLLEAEVRRVVLERAVEECAAP